MNVSNSDDSHWEMVKEVDEHGHGLTDWEISFVANLIDNEGAIRAIGGLSSRQKEVIARIHEERL